jgi:hypothetical protein
MTSTNPRPFPWYHAVNNRPVKVVQRKDGSLDVLALDVLTGDWEPAPDYLDKIFDVGKDVDELTKDEFDALVSRRLAGKPW